MKSLPLYVRILIGVVLGTLFGLLRPAQAALLSDVGLVVIRLLKALATPLLLFAVLDSFLRTNIPARKGMKLIALSALNAVVATTIGLGVANVVRSGEHFRGRLDALTQHLPAEALLPVAALHTPDEPKPTLNPLKNLSGYVPESLLTPFLHNNVIAVVLLAILLGLALRRVKDRGGQEAGIHTIEAVISVSLQVFTQMLEWLILLIPLAVFCVLAGVVSKTGTQVFHVLGIFFLTIVLGLVIHAGLYYSFLLRFLGHTSPRRFFSGALDAIMTALSCGSSLATLPVTLRCLTERLKVSLDAARLAACVGTNLNHDGIILYEACAAVFVAQAFGLDLGLGQQLSIALASVMAGIGIAGIPEAGLITLPLVLAAAKLPDAVAITAIPLILPVDFLIGRCRAATNVISDMTVATVLDRS